MLFWVFTIKCMLTLITNNFPSLWTHDKSCKKGPTANRKNVLPGSQEEHEFFSIQFKYFALNIITHTLHLNIVQDNYKLNHT